MMSFLLIDIMLGSAYNRLIVNHRRACSLAAQALETSIQTFDMVVVKILLQVHSLDDIDASSGRVVFIQCLLIGGAVVATKTTHHTL